MKDTMQNLTKLPKSALLPALGLLFFVLIAVAGVYIAQYQEINRGPVTPNAPGLSQAGGNVCTTSWIAQVPQTPTPTPSVSPSPSPSPTPSTTPSPTPTPTPEVECEDCNWQVDAFWGPVIRDFGKRYVGQTSGPNARYSTNPNGTSQGKRLIWARSDEQNPQFPGCENINPNGDNVAVPVLSEHCKDPLSEAKKFITYDLQSVNHVTGTASIKIMNKTGINGIAPCTYDNVGFVSYKANWSAGFEEQEVFDLKQGILYPNSSRIFVINLPMNNDGPQCHAVAQQCPSPGLTADMFDLPVTRSFPGNPPEPTDVVRYNGGTDPVMYNWVGVMKEGGDGQDFEFARGEGILQPGEAFTVEYPPACATGQVPCPWGTPDEHGTYEAHVKTFFDQVSTAGDECHFSHNWDRYYNNMNAVVSLKNTSLLSSGTFYVTSNNVRLRDGQDKDTFSVGARKTVEVTLGLPKGATSLKVVSQKGTFSLLDVRVLNGLTNALIKDAVTSTQSLKSGTTKTFSF